MGGLAGLVLVGSALVVLGLLVTAGVAAARGRRHRAVVAAGTAGALVALYAAALVGVGAVSPDRSLATGQWRCFDEWCASVDSVVRTGDTVEVALAVQNRGRRDQAPDSPQVWWLHDGRRDEVVVPGLASRVPGGSTAHLPPIRLTSPRAGRPALEVTEGGWPSVLVIGDDNSPFHPRPAWPLG